MKTEKVKVKTVIKQSGKWVGGNTTSESENQKGESKNQKSENQKSENSCKAEREVGRRSW